MRYLIRLDEALTIAELERLSPGSAPKIHEAETADDDDDDDGGYEADYSDETDDQVAMTKPPPPLFAEIDANTVRAIKAARYQNAIISIQDPARKAPSHALCPALGLEQVRAGSTDRSLQSETTYPVWYFFYGTLADPTVVRRHLELPDEDEIELREAVILGGALTELNGHGDIVYKGLVDAAPDARVKGHAYLVQSEDHENALRAYETEAYEVARCWIQTLDRGEVLEGLTFRLVR